MVIYQQDDKMLDFSHIFGIESFCIFYRLFLYFDHILNINVSYGVGGGLELNIVDKTSAFHSNSECRKTHLAFPQLPCRVTSGRMILCMLTH